MPTALHKRQFYRDGRDHRQGREVGFGDIHKRFQFRSIRIGRWVTKAEGAAAAVHFHDALCDLIDILNAPESLISLRSQLSLDYGTGGQLGISAHYVPATRTFALAKNAGPGSIAHEWFHAFDHYISQKIFLEDVPEQHFASAVWLGNAPVRNHPLTELWVSCMNAIFLNETGDRPSTLFDASVATDRATGHVYYSRPEEITARAFEAFVQDAPIKNQFLVKGTKESDVAKAGLYPQGDDRARIIACLQRYFVHLGAALKREGTR